MLVPALAFCAAVALLISARPHQDQWTFTAALLSLGFACRVATALARRIVAPHS